jgi:hypothetical protein
MLSLLKIQRTTEIQYNLKLQKIKKKQQHSKNDSELNKFLYPIKHDI